MEHAQIIGMIGLGNLGTALANVVATNGYGVLGWEYQAAVVSAINTKHENPQFLPGVPLDTKVHATNRLVDVAEHCGTIFVALPSRYIHSTLAPFRGQVPPSTVLVNTAKEIDRNTGLTAAQTLAALFPANEFARGLPTVVMLAGRPTGMLFGIARLLDNTHFRVRFSDDEIGVELGGVLKNAYVIGLGLFDGKQIASVNFRSVYLTLALEEMTRIGVALGGRADTFAYLAGMDDLLATALSDASHNRRMGQLLADDRSLGEIEHTMGVAGRVQHHSNDRVGGGEAACARAASESLVERNRRTYHRATLHRCVHQGFRRLA